MKRSTLYAISCTLALLVATTSGCSAAKVPVQIKTVATNSFCSGTHSLQLIEDEAQWKKAFFKKIIFSRLPKPTLPEVDFNEGVILLITLGEKPTAGYALQHSKNPAIIENRQLMISITTKEPAVGAMLAQVITNPCLAIEIPRDGYDNIMVHDQNGHLFGQLPRP